MEPTVQVAIAGIFTTFITTLGIFAVAVLNNKKERASTAETTLEKAKEERITLRDERIKYLEQKIEDLEEENKDLEDDIQRVKQALKTERKTLSAMKEDLAEEKLLSRELRRQLEGGSNG